MRIRVISDLHYELGNMLEPKPAPDYDVCVIAGDWNTGEYAIEGFVGAREELRRHTIYFPGNHEYYGRFHPMETEERKMADLAWRNPYLHFLNPGSVVIDGVRFVAATLWTDYCLFGEDKQAGAMKIAAQWMQDHRQIHTKEDGKIVRFMPHHALARHRRELAFIEETLATPFDGPTVVCTHHGPSFRSVPEEYDEDTLSAAFSSNLDAVIERHQPALWIHGHTHDSMDYMIGDTRVVCNPAGYQHEPNPNFRWDCIIEIPTHDCEPTKGFGL